MVKNNKAKDTKNNSFSTNREVVVKRGLNRIDNRSLALRGLLSDEWKTLKGMATKAKREIQNANRSNKVRWELLSKAWSNKTEDDFQSNIVLDKGFIPVFVYHK